jgi:hypothetical protein
MQLVNQTPVVADVRVATLEGTPHRYGLLVAKATFRVAPATPTAISTLPCASFVRPTSARRSHSIAS